MKFKVKLMALAAALAVVACGGGSETTTVRVVGDSLNDSGTFGFKFTIQGSAAEPHYIWTERVTTALGAVPQCPRYIVASATSVVPNPNAASCTSGGVGGARINPSGLANDTTPFSVVQQLKDAAGAQGYAPVDLLLADGGGNDVSDLVSTYLAAATDQGASYTALLAELLGTSRVAALASAGSTGLAAAGVEYTTALANQMADAVIAHALNRGASRVLIVNAPDVTKTPRFQAVLAGVSMASGGGAAGAAAAAQVGALVDSWTKAYNAQLSKRFEGEPRVAILDFYSELNRWVANPSAYGLTNVSQPACPQVGTDSTGLPAYPLQTCSSASLSSSSRAVAEGPNWWTTYLFSDNFHGTPRTNQLVADLALNALASKGWR